MVRSRRFDQRSEEDSRRLQALSAAVYPPNDVDDWPGRHIEWASPDYDVEIFDDHGELVSYTGLVIRHGTHDDMAVLIAGIGSVKTHPAARGRGLAPRGIEAALDVAIERSCDFALLVCEDELVPYYAKSGWSLFEGTMLTIQKGEKTRFEFNNVMVRPLSSAAPANGTIDLEGPPW